MAISRSESDDGDQIRIGDRFCLPCTAELVVKKKVQALSNAHYDVFDTTGNKLLQVDGGVWNLQRKRVMRDPSGSPVLTLREKQAFTWRNLWTIHEGEGSETKDLLCNVQSSQALQIKTKLDVFLSENQTNKDCDFQISGSLASFSFKVHKGNNVIAEVIHNFTWSSFVKGKESFVLRVKPEMDYAFIVALLVIVHENDSG